MQCSEDENINTFSYTTPSGASHLLHLLCAATALHFTALSSLATALLP